MSIFRCSKAIVFSELSAFHSMDVTPMHKHLHKPRAKKPVTVMMSRRAQAHRLLCAGDILLVMSVCKALYTKPNINVAAELGK